MSFFDFPGSAANVSHTNVYGSFPNPFDDYASSVRPKTLPNILKWAEYMWGRLGTWREAMQRVVRYFITGIQLTGGSDNEREDYMEFLSDTLKLLPNMAVIGDDFMTYNNSFTSLYLPFRRFLRCMNPKCNLEILSQEVDYEFAADRLEFTATCPRCGRKGPMAHIDRRSTNKESIKIIRFSPHGMRIRYHQLSHRADYFWDIPNELKKHVKNGEKFYIEDTPWEVLQAISLNQAFKLNSRLVYHMKEPTLAGVENRGWGIPHILYNWAAAYRLQIYKRHDEALAMDYVVPVRMFTPKARGGEGGDPMTDSNLGDFNYHIMQMIAEHRRDPTSWHAVPFPVDYQTLGGDQRQFAPVESINNAMDEFLNASGYPAEMYRGTLSMQAAPTALRLFQQTWISFVNLMNDWLNWVLDTISVHMIWDKVRGELQPTTLVEDITRRELMLQLAAGGLISRSSALAALNLDAYKEQRKIIEEQIHESREQERAQKLEMDRQEQMSRLQGMGLASAPGGPMGQPAAPVAPQDITAQAEQIAQQLFYMQDDRARRNYITQILHSNPTLHHIVVGKLDQLRQSAASQGQQMIQQGMI